MKQARIAIIGAGLGGLTAAIALLQRGFDVRVFEQASALGEVGAGVQLAPNAMKVMMALGLEPRMRATAFEPEAHVVRNWKTGGVVATSPMKPVYRRQYGAPYYTFHRADLHAALVEAFPAERIALNAKCTGIQDTVVSFADGSRFEADAVIGAGGIHSVIRDALLGPQSPRFTGIVCWRGLVPVDTVPAGLVSPDMNGWFGPHSTIVHYHVRGGRLVNWAAFFEQDWRMESWRIEGNKQEVLDVYESWNPTIRELVSRTEKLYKWAIFDREPLPYWTRGRVTLLGDAAHAMLPYLAQGACMAIEDAYVLAASLAGAPDVETALQRYEAERRPRTARVQIASRARARPNQLVSPLAQLGRDLVYKLQKLVNPGKHTYKVEWIYGYDATATSERREAAVVG
jgi:salicylate hydroxylase